MSDGLSDQIRKVVIDAMLRWEEQSKSNHWEIDNIEIPFGKYQGKMFREVPLRYLDETVSKFPDTWVSRRARDYVDAAMFRLRALCFTRDCGFIYTAVPNKTLVAAEKELLQYPKYEPTIDFENPKS